jgi:mRNA-degrading endonuclease toxin of MazEF toxin-antitoxin module
MLDIFSLYIIAAPLTSNTKNIYPFESKVILNGRECKILMDKIRALDRKRLGQKIASIDSIILYKAEEALKVALDLRKD